jgi:uncharacterized protein (DUF885 family)
MPIFARLFVLLCAALCAGAASADWIRESNENALKVLRAQAEFVPESVAGKGLNAYDGEIIDLRASHNERETASNVKLIAELELQLASEEDSRVREDLQIMVQYLADKIESREIAHEYLIPYHNLHAFLFSSFNVLLDPRNDRARYASALERLRKYTGAAEGYTPLTELAVQRMSARFQAKGLLGPYDGQVKMDLENAPNLVAGIRAAFERSGLQGWEGDFSLLEIQLDAYAGWVRAELLPRARPESRLPAEIYASNLRHYGVRATPEHLIAVGQYGYQLIRNEMEALARQIAEQRGWEDKRLVPVILKIKQEQVSRDELLALYQERLTQIENIVRREDIMSLPQRSAQIRMASAAESAAVPASHMSPPRLIDNTGEFGEFVLVAGNASQDADALMDDWSHQAVTWVLTTHEARPGHEMQYSSMVENGTSLARALFAFNSANAEGWGMYAESVMQQYLPFDAQLFSLYNRLFRAARIFLDPMVNTGQLTAKEAEDFLVEQLGMSRAMARSDAQRYAFREPGQATSYYYGYMGIMRLRTEVEIALGDDFNQREFHDFVIEQGFLPPELLRTAVLEKFVTQVEKD